jgi:hypothetical protein
LPHCLSALVRDPKGRLGLWNRRTGLPVATRLVAAFDSPSRRRGLLGRPGLRPDEALILAPCSAVHTAFMGFPIDLVFLNRAGRVLKVAPGVRPWRIRAAWRAFAVVELGPGSAARSDVKAGDIVELRTLV